jgi:hypothetical protein
MKLEGGRSFAQSLAYLAGSISEGVVCTYSFCHQRKVLQRSLLRIREHERINVLRTSRLAHGFRLARYRSCEVIPPPMNVTMRLDQYESLYERAVSSMLNVHTCSPVLDTD